MNQVYDNGREQRGRVRRHVELGRDRAEDQAERGRQRVQTEAGNSGERPATA